MNDNNFTLQNVVLPVGSITAFAGNVASYLKPQPLDGSVPVTQPIESFGWMLCDGSSLSANLYPELYAVLGNLYGGLASAGNDATFNLPDLRGQFLRGISTDKPSLEKRTASAGGMADGIGSTQEDALQTHQHNYVEPTGLPAVGENGKGTATVNASAYTGIPTSESDASSIKVSDYETRPTNIFVNYLIKYTYKLPVYNHFPTL